MRELFKEASKITNSNIILAIPLFVFIKVLNIYSFFSIYHADNTLKLLLSLVTILFMCGVFSAAWFYMVKGAVNLSKEVYVLDVENPSLKLFKTIPEGVGKYFMSFVGVYVVMFFIQLFFTPLVYILGLKLIGGLDAVTTQQLLAIVSDNTVNSNAAMTSFVENLTPEQIAFFGKWSLFFMAATFVFMYLLMLWIPEIIYNTKNPVLALWNSIRNLFKDFINTFRLFSSLWFMGFAILFINTFAMFNPITYILVSILIFYFTLYLTILIFLYYDKKYVAENEK